jgi:hypothetical protein
MHIVAVLVTLMVSHHNFTTKQNYDNIHYLTWLEGKMDLGSYLCVCEINKTLEYVGEVP